MKKGWRGAQAAKGFTIAELMIVIAVIGILAAISLVAYNGVQDRARQSKINNDLSELQRAINSARALKRTTLAGITGATSSTNSSTNCISASATSELAALSQSSACWTTYNAALAAISDASGVNVKGMVDPWGNPYSIQEKEGVVAATPCQKDILGAYPHPRTQGSATVTSRIDLDYSLSSC